MTARPATKPYNICSLPDGLSEEPPLLLALLRDGLLVVAALLLVLMLARWSAESGVWLAAIVGVVAFAAGFQTNAVFHEWGHYAGARLTGAYAPRNPIRRIFPMFHFDIHRNTHVQFLALSVGGNVFQWIYALTLALLVGGHTVGEVALKTGAVAFALFGTITELPIIIDAIRRGDGVAAWQAYLPKREGRKKITAGIGIPMTVAVFVLFLT